MNKLKIKISNIQHLTDARYFSSQGVDYLGFDRFLTSSADVQLIQEWVYGPQVVSEFIGNTCELDIRKLLDEHKTEVLHFDFFTDNDTLVNFSDYELFQDMVLGTMTLDQLTRKMEKADGIVDFFVLKSEEQFSERQAKIIQNITNEFPCFLDIKLNFDNLSTIKSLGLEGIILRGGVEEKVGVKSFDELDEIFEILSS